VDVAQNRNSPAAADATSDTDDGASWAATRDGQPSGELADGERRMDGRTTGDQASAEVAIEEQSGGRAAASEGESMQSETEAGESIIDRYFPLRVGAAWQYAIRVTADDDQVVAEATVRKSVEGTRVIQGKEYMRLVTRTLAGAELRAPDQHYRVTDEGICAAVEGAAGQELLVFPRDPATNRGWTGAAPPVIKQITAKVQTDQEVQCGKARYSSCVYVDLDMSMRGGGFFGPAQVPVRMERWFAPGVGLVRERRTADGRVIEAILEVGAAN
jgi:hypothetical protein